MTDSDDFVDDSEIKKLYSITDVTKQRMKDSDLKSTIAIDPYHPPPMDHIQFSSWEEFHSYQEVYCNRTYQIFKRRTSKSIQARNKELQQKGCQLFDVKWNKFSISYICTQGWGHRPKGTGIRPDQKSRATNCPITLVARLQRGRDGKCFIGITKMVLRHNHKCNQKWFESMRGNDLIKNSELMSKVQEYHFVGVPFQKLYRYVTNANEEVTKQDLRNALSTIKKEVKVESHDLLLLHLLEGFANESNQYNVVRVIKDDDGYVIAIIFQTGEMRMFADNFIEVLMIDSTHCTNDSKYKLFSFMVHDSFGNGQYVLHSLIDQETKANMKHVVQFFKDFNRKWEDVAVIVVDKDMTEINVLKEAFSNASVLLCQFHVLKYFQTVRGKENFDFNGEEKKLLLKSVRSMTYAENQKAYLTARDSFIDKLEDEKKQKWCAYFFPNWDSITSMWVKYLRVNLPHLGNNTNNRIESGWGKLKPSLNQNMTMFEALSEIMFSQIRKEKEFRNKVEDTKIHYHHNFDKEMNALRQMTSKWAADLVNPEYIAATNPELKYPYSVDGSDLAYVQGFRDKYTIRRENWTCSCQFATIMLLPCRHIFNLRVQLKVSPVIPLLDIHKRWRRQVYEIVSEDQPWCPNEERFQVRKAIARIKTQQERFSTARGVALQICDALSQREGKSYLKVLQALKRFRDVVYDDGIPTVIVEDKKQVDSLGMDVDHSTKKTTVNSEDEGDITDCDINKAEEYTSVQSFEMYKNGEETTDRNLMLRVPKRTRGRQKKVNRSALHIHSPKSKKSKTQKRGTDVTSISITSDHIESQAATSKAINQKSFMELQHILQSATCYSSLKPIVDSVYEFKVFKKDEPVTVTEVSGGYPREVRCMNDVDYIFSKHFVETSYEALAKYRRDSRPTSKENPLDIDDETGSIFVDCYVYGKFTTEVIETMFMIWEKKEEIQEYDETLSWVHGMKNQLDKDSAICEKLCGEVCDVVKLTPFSAMTLENCPIWKLFTFRYNEWLNDFAIQIRLEWLQERYDTVTVVNSSVWNTFTEDIPSILRRGVLRTSGYTLLPVNYTNSHWIVMIVDWNELKIVRFDPLQERTYLDHLSSLSKKYLSKVLDTQTSVVMEVKKKKKKMNTKKIMKRKRLQTKTLSSGRYQLNGRTWACHC